MSGIFGNSIPLMKKSLDYLWSRQTVISNNIAHVDTPGYKAGVVTFEEQFKRELDVALESNDFDKIRETLESGNIMQIEQKDDEAKADGNNVNMDVEQMEMTRTAMQYQFVAQSITDDLTRLRTVIKGQ